MIDGGKGGKNLIRLFRFTIDRKIFEAVAREKGNHGDRRGLGIRRLFCNRAGCVERGMRRGTPLLTWKGTACLFDDVPHREEDQSAARLAQIRLVLADLSNESGRDLMSA